MKKLLLILLSVSLVASMLVGCGEEAKPETIVDDVVSDDAVVPEKDSVEDVPDGTPSVDESVNKPSTSPNTTPEKQEEVKPAKPSTTPSKPTTQQQTDNTSSSTQESNPTAREYSIEEVHKIVKNTYGEDYRPNVEIPGEALKDLFGINLDDVDAFIAEQPMISANIDTFIAIKAKSGKADSVANALNSYKDGLLNGAMMYPSNMPKAQSAKVIRHGDFVFLVMLGASGDMEADEATQLNFAKAQVEKGVNAINDYFAK